MIKASANSTIPELYSCRIKIQSLEKELCAFLKKPSWNDENASELMSCIAKTSENIFIEGKHLFGQVDDVKISINTLVSLIQRVSSSPTYIEQLKDMMEKIECDLLHTKHSHNKLENQMILEEKKITQELSSFNDRIANWNSSKPTANNLVPLLSAQEDRQQDQRVTDFQRHVSRRGKEWDDINHLIFARLYNRLGDQGRLVHAVCSEIPGMSAELTKNHIAWYETFLRLDEAKKDAISEWKAARVEVVETVQEEIVDLIQNEDESRANAAQSELISRNEQKKRINGWKKVKSSEKDKQEKLKTLNSIAVKKRNELWRLEQAHQRTLVKQYRLEQNNDDARAKQASKIQEEKEKLKQRDRSVSVIEKSKQRTRENTNRISSIKTAKQDQILKRKQTQEKIASQVEIIATRDPKRLFRQTAVQAERAKKLTGDKQLIGELTAQYAPRILPHRSVPSWRAGL